MKQKTIALLYHYVAKETNDDYFSHDHVLVDNQTDEIVEYLSKTFKKRKYAIQIIRVSPDDYSELKNIKADYIFNLVDSKAMELRIAKMLDRMHIPHSGASAEAIAMTNNKVRAKRIFEANNLPTPKYTVLPMGMRLTRALVPSKFPLIVKPAYEHCSIGITDNSIATTYVGLQKVVKKLRATVGQTLIIEEFIPGREFQVTILETPEETKCLPIAEIAFKGKVKNKWNIYGFDEKWSKTLPIWKSCHFIAPPAHLEAAIEDQIKLDAVRAFYAFKMKDYVRFDMRYDPKTERWYFLEGNANAGFDPHPRDAMTASVVANGMSLEDFAVRIVKNSLH
jgi:D-alanine-D-alanine ligase